MAFNARQNRRDRDRYNLNQNISNSPEDREPTGELEAQPEAAEISDPQLEAKEEQQEELESGEGDNELVEETIADALAEIQNAVVTPSTPTPLPIKTAVEATYTEDQKVFLNKSPEEVLSMFGSDRGRISRAIRYLISIGFDKGQTAKLINRRYQHVRNVLIETAKSNEAALRRQEIQQIQASK